ncbi:hypothetical protein QWY90_08595 [Flavobacterium paronense]|uniref:Cytochrome c domain-containing protein n=1 Tax=Flavobacterium paronense TaxID=1392775 RepID=A0ABV5GA86_9FLAO|nr:hypothetical protein [Flavobacterium paronense]MDN3677374.1 hypothetical protein [Flavobacterium paronense]
MKKIIVLVLFFGIFSCQNKVEKPDEKKCSPGKEKKLEMYQMSEMAALMEQMYLDNQRVKKNIIKGVSIGKFPEHYLKIYSAKFTDETDNDLFFKEQAKEYIKAQQLLYSDPINAKKHFNAGVDACLKCHENKCGGPIPRIKKLYIK